MSALITYHRATTNAELEAILTLQAQNLRHVIPEKDKQKDGFVTLQHDFEILKKMNDACPHCIAKQDGKIVGYALSMLQEFKDQIPLLVPMFKEIDKAIKAQHLSTNYIAMGQICINKRVRGQGVFRGLYRYMADQLKDSFDAIITEVDTKNTRSSQAHQAVGFKVIKKYTSNNQFWEIIRLDI